MTWGGKEIKGSKWGGKWERKEGEKKGNTIATRYLELDIA